MEPAHRYSVPIDGSSEVFTINSRYRIIRKLGSGYNGTVCSAYDLQDNSYCAIKKLYGACEKRLFTKRFLREIKALQHLNQHPRVISLLDVDIVDPENFAEVYMVFDCMDASLHDVIQSGEPINTVQCQWILYQMLSGLKYIHAAQIIHRDLKPANILVNRNCDIKICNFGMARGYQHTSNRDTNGFMTECVTTRWYRAPEIMLSQKSYGYPIDIWSVGCIFGEMLSGKVLFKGRDYVDQIHKILEILGLPCDITFWEPSEPVITYFEELCTVDGQPPPRDPIDFSHLFPQCPAEGIRLLESLLHLNPDRRITVIEALAHPFIYPFGDSNEEALQPLSPCVFQFEQCGGQAELMRAIHEEVRHFRFRRWQIEREIRSASMYDIKMCNEDYSCHASMSILDQVVTRTGMHVRGEDKDKEVDNGDRESETELASAGIVCDPEEMTEEEEQLFFEELKSDVNIADPSLAHLTCASIIA